MTLNAFEWIVICTVASVALTVIAYFIKRTMNTTDEHTKEIQEIKQTYTPKSVSEKYIDEIHNIKEQFITRAEFKEEMKPLIKDVEDIKENSLRKVDYFRTHGEIAQQVSKMYQFLMEKGGR